MPDDVPPDVYATLSQLLRDARDRARAGETDPVSDAVGTVESVARNKLPEGDLRDRLLHGCEEVSALADEEPAAAAEYLRAMHEALEAATD